MIRETRSGLLQIKKRIKLASKGHRLLKEKRDSLLGSLNTLIREINSISGSIDHRCASARISLEHSVHIDENIENIANDYSDSKISVEQKNVMGAVRNASCNAVSLL